MSDAKPRRICLLVIACLTLIHYVGLAAWAAERPNIIFFLSDDQRADFLGCAGHPILQTPTTAQPSVSSQSGEVQANDDGSVTVWFGPEPPPGKASNWVPTVPGKGWFMILRLYGPLEPWLRRVDSGQLTQIAAGRDA